MRVAIIAPPWLPVPPPAYGGTELVLDGLCRGLVADGHDVLLCTTGDSTCPVERSWTLEASVGTDGMPSGLELRHAIAAYEAAVEWGADIVHDHTLVGPFHAQSLRGPIVTTNHGPFDADLAPVYAALAARASIIAISHHHASTAGDVPIDRVIHHGLDLSRFPVGSGRGGYAVFLGRMSPTKGVHTAALIARRAGVPLRIAAKLQEPAEREYFEASVKPLLGDGVEYIGEVGGEDKTRLLGDALCLLNPIEWPEPFGMVMIESLACGTPVVVTPSGAAPEIVDDGVTGYIRRGERALAAAVQQVHLLDRAACRAAAEARFSSLRMAGDHSALYAELANVAACSIRGTASASSSAFPETTFREPSV